MKFYFVPYHIVADKIQSIIEANKDDFVKHYGDVNVDYTHFNQLSQIGLAYAALAIESDVIGFAGFVINEVVTSKGLEAQNVVMYIDKAHRGKLFDDLLDYSKQELKKAGVDNISVTIKSDVLARALRKNAFRKEYEVWELACG